MLRGENGDRIWVNDPKLSGLIRRSTRGWVVRKSGVDEAPHPPVTFVMPRNGQSAVVKLNGATTLVAAQQRLIGAAL